MLADPAPDSTDGRVSIKNSNTGCWFVTFAGALRSWNPPQQAPTAWARSSSTLTGSRRVQGVFLGMAAEHQSGGAMLPALLAFWQ